MKIHENRPKSVETSDAVTAFEKDIEQMGQRVQVRGRWLQCSRCNRRRRLDSHAYWTSSRCQRALRLEWRHPKLSKPKRGALGPSRVATVGPLRSTTITMVVRITTTPPYCGKFVLLAPPYFLGRGRSPSYVSIELHTTMTRNSTFRSISDGVSKIFNENRVILREK